MSTKVDEVQLDIDELNSFLQQAKRQRTKDVLSVEVMRLQTELSKLIKEAQDASLKPEKVSSVPATKCYEVKLNNYGWDETNNVVKLYVSLKDVQTLPKEAVTCEFTEKSMDLRVLGLDNKNYHLPINNLCEEIDQEKSTFKVKTDMIVVTLAKKVQGKKWPHVTRVEKRIKDSKKNPLEETDDGDLGSKMMSLLSKMYNEGDDEMKRTIAKAWTEHQNQRTSI